VKFGNFMSRIGKKPIEIIPGVEAKITGQKVLIKGPQGELSLLVRPEIKVEIKTGQIFVTPQIETKKSRAFWGTTRALLQNMVKGVTRGYEKRLEIEGVGFRAELEGQDLVLNVGFTHAVKIKAPQNIKFAVDKNTIIVSGVDKGLVGEMAAKIRRVRPPEPYKGKGIRYTGEQIRRKVGKKAVSTTAAK